MLSAPIRFAFCLDGTTAAEGSAEMSVTYLGRINRKQAEADARRRFEEWQRMPNALSRRWSKDQVVVS